MNFIHILILDHELATLDKESYQKDCKGKQLY